MADMTQFSGKKEFPSQTENRKQWILDTVRANQETVGELLRKLELGYYRPAKDMLRGMRQMDRDALLMEGGILTNEQIEKLK